MAQQHPSAAAYVSADGKVSFDRYGRKLDSTGNVVAGDRQRAGDAGGKPIERRQEQQPQGPPAQPTAAGYTFPANATGLPVQRSAWDKSVVQPAMGAASVAGVSGAGRGNNPNVLAPGGIDPATGRPYPTALNGDLQVSAPSGGTAWRQPWMGPQQATGNIQMQTGGLNTGQSWRGTTPNANMPYPPTGASRGNQYIPETFTRQTVPVYDPNKLSWLVP